MFHLHCTRARAHYLCEAVHLSHGWQPQRRSAARCLLSMEVSEIKRSESVSAPNEMNIFPLNRFICLFSVFNWGKRRVHCLWPKKNLIKLGKPLEKLQCTQSWQTRFLMRVPSDNLSEQYEHNAWKCLNKIMPKTVGLKKFKFSNKVLCCFPPYFPCFNENTSPSYDQKRCSCSSQAIAIISSSAWGRFLFLLSSLLWLPTKTLNL